MLGTVVEKPPTAAEPKQRRCAIRYNSELGSRSRPSSPRRPALLGRSGGVFVLFPNALEVLDRRKPQERKRRRPLAGGRLANLLGQAGLSSAIKLRSVSPAFDPFSAQRIELSHHPESDNCKVMIERAGEPYSRT
jgi:hypothetical protein